MAKEIINVGSSANDGTGDPNRTAFQKCNSNFDELYADEGKGTLQQVTDNGNTTTNDITAGGFLSLGNANIPGINFNDAEDLDTSLGFLGAEPSITTPRNWLLPDTSGTIALTSDIPTELSELTDDPTHRLVTDTQISTWDGKQNTLTETNFGSFINGLTAKNTLVDADEVVSDDSADSNKAKKTSWLNIWLNYLKPKADALYATISNLALKQDFATATTGAVISFSVPQVYNSVASPTASNITDSLGTAKIGIVQKIYSNKATEPTYPAGWVKLSGTYTNSVTNIIYCEWCEGSRVEYWIVKA